VFLPIGFTLYAFWRWRRHPRPLAAWLGLQAIAALIYLPWVLYAAPRLIPYISQKVVVEADRPLDLFTYLGRHLSAFAIGHVEGSLALWWPLGLLPLLPIVWMVWRHGQARWSQPEAPAEMAGTTQRWQVRSLQPEVRFFLATALATSLGLGFLLNLRYPFFPARGERLLLLAAPLFWLLAAEALSSLWQKHRRLALATGITWGCLALASLVTFYMIPRYPADDYRPLIQQVQQQGQPDDVVWCVYPWQVGYFWAYRQPDDPAARLLPAQAWGPTAQAAFDDTLAQGRRAWLPEHLSLGGILEGEIEAYLLGRTDVYPTVNAWYGPNTRLTFFTPAAGPGLVSPLAERPAQFGQILRLVRSILAPYVARDPAHPESAQNPQRLRPQSDVIRVDLEWDVIGSAPPQLQVGLRLADEAGRTWSQRDSQPVGGSQPFDRVLSGQMLRDRHGMMIPSGVPAGRYTVWLKVYDPMNGRALDLVRPDGRTQGTELALGQVDVWPSDRTLHSERLPIATRQTVDLSDGMRFLGYTVAPGPFEPGRAIPISLFWSARRDLEQEYLTFVQLLDDQRNLLAAWEGPPAESFPTYEWQSGALVWQQVELRLPATVPDGNRLLIVGLFRLPDRTRLTTAERFFPPRARQDYIALRQVAVRGRPHSIAQPAPQYPLAVQIGAFARLVGYDLQAADAQPGGSLHLTLYWQAIEPVDIEYTVFVHLVGASGEFRGQTDAPPGNGDYPTTGWLPGEYLTDVHTLNIAADAPPGAYTLEVGMYLPGTNARLPVRSATGEALGDVLQLSDAPIVVR
jgi:hypothetical protein